MIESQFPPPPPAAKRRSAKRIILLVVAIVLAICCAGGTAIGFLIYRSVQSAMGPVQDAGARYVADLNAGNWSAAYGQTCAATRRLMTEQEFIEAQEAAPKATGYELVGTNVGHHNGRTRAAINLRVSYPGGEVRAVRVPLEQEGGQWRPCP
ncbi:hypothetical protein ABNF97_05920 [Plantactinospora sp. B6F1]|uniref:Rv0361 family membrane protein n=1 Tax=Plantactinospora sp. B6F1 TaxID=3158971 RepID=UPI00102C24F8